MADDVDRANEKSEQIQEGAIAVVKRLAQGMPAGEPGDCDGCGEYFVRLVSGYCGRCRDKGVRKRRI